MSLYLGCDMTKEEFWTEFADVNFSEGASFIGDPDLDPQYIPGILGFFASLVQFESKKRTHHVKDSAIYDAMPELLINFAEKSRVASGYCLMA